MRRFKRNKDGQYEFKLDEYGNVKPVIKDNLPLLIACTLVLAVLITLFSV